MRNKLANFNSMLSAFIVFISAITVYFCKRSLLILTLIIAYIFMGLWGLFNVLISAITSWSSLIYWCIEITEEDIR